MFPRLVRTAFALLAVLFFSSAPRLHAARILIWDNDQDSGFFDTQTRRIVSSELSVKRALEKNGHQVTVVKRLPEQLDSYDAVFVLLGFLCPS